MPKPKGKTIGYVSLAGLLGQGPFIIPAEPKPYRYEGREYADPFRLPSHMDPTGGKGKHGWTCDACDATSPRTWSSKRDRAANAKEHDCN